MPRGAGLGWLGPLLNIPTPVVFVAASAMAIALLWRQGALGEIGDPLRQAHPGRIAAILVVYALSILLLAMRWHLLVRMAGGSPFWTTSGEVFLTSVMVNYAAPIGLAVPTRAALSVRDLGLTAAQSGAVVAWELALDIAALLFLTLLWISMGGAALLDTLPIDNRLLLAAVAMVGLVGAALLAASRVAMVRSRVERVVRPMWHYPRQRPSLALLAVAATIVYWAVQAGIMGAMLGLFGAATSPAFVLGLMGLPVLIGMLSPIPGGAGVREGLMAATARLEGVAMTPVLLAAVSYRLALFVVTPLVWGVLRLLRAIVRPTPAPGDG